MSAEKPGSKHETCGCLVIMLDPPGKIRLFCVDSCDKPLVVSCLVIMLDPPGKIRLFCVDSCDKPLVVRINGELSALIPMKKEKYRCIAEGIEVPCIMAFRARPIESLKSIIELISDSS